MWKRKIGQKLTEGVMRKIAGFKGLQWAITKVWEDSRNCERQDSGFFLRASRKPINIFIIDSGPQLDFQSPALSGNKFTVKLWFTNASVHEQWEQKHLAKLLSFANSELGDKLEYGHLPQNYRTNNCMKWVTTVTSFKPLFLWWIFIVLIGN